MGLLDGRNVLITGSTRGIGRAMAEAFAREGGRVIVNGRREEDAQAAAAAIPGSVGIGGDMADLNDINALVARANETVGPIHILVNNAAISRRSAVTRVTNEEWEEVIRINLTGPFYVARAVIPGMKASGGGVIVNVISGAATHGSIGFSSYAAAKGGLLGLTMTWSKELAAFGIRVNAFSPSALTDMMLQLPPEALDLVRKNLATPEAVAGAALALVSDLSKTVNGQIISSGGTGR